MKAETPSVTWVLRKRNAWGEGLAECWRCRIKLKLHGGVYTLKNPHCNRIIRLPKKEYTGIAACIQDWIVQDFQSEPETRCTQPPCHEAHEGNATIRR
jgi:hypothetical protein